MLLVIYYFPKQWGERKKNTQAKEGSKDKNFEKKIFFQLLQRFRTVESLLW